MCPRQRNNIPRRRSRSRPLKRRILLVCEGCETERNYFDQLKRTDQIRNRFAVKIIRGRGGSRLQIAQRAIDRKNEHGAGFDEVWCIMDVEEQGQIQATKEATALLESESIKHCLSNPAFEVWLLAHFIRTPKYFANCDQVIQELQKYWSDVSVEDYSKGDRRIFTRLEEKTRTALENTRSVRETAHNSSAHTADCNSSTDIARFIDILIRTKR